MKFKILFMIFISVVVFADEIITIHPKNSNNGKRWYSIAASSSASHDFYFDTASQRTSYSGFMTIVMRIDSATVAGDRDGFSCSIRPLHYNHATGAWEESSEADKDSTSIKSSFDWGTNDADGEYDFAVTANLEICDGFRMYIYTGADGQCVYRPEAKKTIDQR